MARSRTPKGSATSGTASSRSTSPGVSASCGRRFSRRGSSNSLAGLCMMTFCRVSQRNQSLRMPKPVALRAPPKPLAVGLDVTPEPALEGFQDGPGDLPGPFQVALGGPGQKEFQGVAASFQACRGRSCARPAIPGRRPASGPARRGVHGRSGRGWARCLRAALWLRRASHSTAAKPLGAVMVTLRALFLVAVRGLLMRVSATPSGSPLKCWLATAQGVAGRFRHPPLRARFAPPPPLQNPPGWFCSHGQSVHVNQADMGDGSPARPGRAGTHKRTGCPNVRAGWRGIRVRPAVPGGRSLASDSTRKRCATPGG